LYGAFVWARRALNRQKRRFPARAVLWDDRTLHCNAPGVGEAPATAELLRACCYVCMTPKANASPEVIAGRHRAVELGWGTGGYRLPVAVAVRAG
jgi:hypothetical protein